MPAQEYLDQARRLRALMLTMPIPLFGLGVSLKAFSMLALLFGLAAAVVVVAGGRKGPRRVDDVSAAVGDGTWSLSGASPDLEVERSVRDRLYGRRAGATATAAPRPRLATRDTGRLARRAVPHGAAPGSLVGGRYRLLERVGAGGTATVYRAWDERLERDVAVKVIAKHRVRDPLAVRRFRREAELCARVVHPNIVTILNVGDEPRDFVVMEFVHGVDARTLLQRRGRLTPDETIHVLAQVCEALAHAHDRDVLHHDVSPDNILVRRRDGTAKLADFGVGSDALDVAAGRVADITGTPGYVAPEILRGARPSPLSDLYSLGVVAYRLLAGLSPARHGDPGATAPLPTAAPRMPPLDKARPGLPRGLTDAIEQSLAKEPDARQDSVAEFCAQLVDGHGAPLRLQRREALRAEAVRRELPSAA
ncbi:MAG: serine/threonine protein kinase [Actinomycetota bacterium]|nr:serine/threonine protein kinase [Actinomycetota bacterium]